MQRFIFFFDLMNPLRERAISYFQRSDISFYPLKLFSKFYDQTILMDNLLDVLLSNLISLMV